MKNQVKSEKTPPSHSLHDIDIDELFNDDAPSSLLSKLMVGLFVLFIAVGLGWVGTHLWNQYQDRSPSHIAVIEADAGPTKMKPVDPGGMVVPNMDKTVYNQLSKNPKTPEETLLPNPEEPLDLLPPPEDVALSLKHDLSSGEAPLPMIPPAVPVTSTEVQEPRSEAEQVTIPEPKNLVQPVNESPNIIMQKGSSTTMPAMKKDSSSQFIKGATVVQLGAFKTEREAKQTWAQLNRAYPKLFQGLEYHISRKVIENKGTFYRLRAGVFDSDHEPKMVCKKLTVHNLPCFVTKME